MYSINNSIKETKFNGLQVHKIIKTDTIEILSICLEKGALFPEHSSPLDAQLIVLEGNISFSINNAVYKLTEQQHFSFPKNVEHWVKANENSKFIIIR
ncbi:Cupin domain-containing protein [Maribacter vaceletii]|uniref:Cupin domain-containing protein n=1 Tax=Maribacter vaceletii TaxID=1206816 RepID=A0A495EBN3_9FLAO|nr:cupin domain-containing protein [Maribacter vaceletii]RKR14236.1 Cupin domain-containing protein [Maribacter vaceletii]